MTDPDALPAPLRHEPANRRLAAAVRPADWPVPEPPAGGYDLVVIGGGTAGLAAAHGAAALGARVALVERHLLGGEGLLAGDVASVALLAEARRATEGGRTPDGPAFAAAMAGARAARADRAPLDGAERLRDAGADVYFDTARFESPDRVAACGRSLRFGRAILAIGGGDGGPDLPGIEAVGPLWPAQAFELERRPEHLIILGGGARGCELAQAFARLGAPLTMIVPAGGLLPGEDPDAGRLLAAALARDGVRVLASARLKGAERVAAGSRLIVVGDGGAEERLEADVLLLASSPRAAPDTLDLAAAGIAVADGRPLADDHLRTTNPRVFVAGGAMALAADATARLALRNALLLRRERASLLTMPRMVHTAPEVAFVGMRPEEAAALGTTLETLEQPIGPVQAAERNGAAGFLRVHVAHGTDRIVGAVAVGPGAGALVALITLAMERGVGLARIAALALPQVTGAAALASVAGAHRRDRLTRPARAALGAWFAVRRLGRSGAVSEEMS